MATVMDDKYRTLIERFPLRSIRDEEMFGEAQGIYVELGLKPDKTADEKEYFGILGDLIGQYERQLPEIQEMLAEVDALTGQDLLEGMLEDNGIGQRELSRQLEIPQSHISEYLAGKRGLSKQNALKIAKRFGLPVEKFL